MNKSEKPQYILGTMMLCILTREDGEYYIAVRKPRSDADESALSELYNEFEEVPDDVALELAKTCVYALENGYGNKRKN